MLRFQNVYRRCLCFIFDQTTMAQEQSLEEHLTFHLQYKHSGTFAIRKYELRTVLPQESENVRPYSINSIENATPL